MGFEYKQRTFAQNDIAGQTAALHEDGFALIPGVLSAAEVAEARAAIDRLRPFGFDKMGKTEHYKCVFNRERLFLDFLDREGVVDLAESTMGKECHIIGQSAWRSHPGHDGWQPHTDHTLVTMPEEVASDPKAFPIYLCTAHYYLNDHVDEELCPTYVIPGSHKSGRALSWGKETQPEWHGKTLEPVLCKAGDVLFFRSEIWHTGSLNKTVDTLRYLLQVHYSHRTIAQRFSPFPWTFNPEILAVANERQLRLLGKHPEGAYG
ncbi:MAG: phytanoyl-CoA dioxygenase family protein [Armatimonadetes bacterium]|nr:phytanoyl-CoA dioxygenase family protein [Armatimonadota bacterium]